MTGACDQSAVIAFLADPESYPARPGRVERHETHGAFVFLAGDDAYKIKRAVAYDYMDFSTLQRRKAVVAREVAINRSFAPDLYLGTVAITRETNGRLAFDGNGVPVEYAVHMRRFAQECVLSNLARQGPLPTSLATALADAVHAAHCAASRCIAGDRSERVAGTLEAVAAQLDALAAVPDDGQAATFRALASLQLERCRAVIARRGREGCARRCHGDLHLDNVVILNGQPTLFDALEFDEDMATIDTLYDLAFLLMDLDRAGQRAAANIVLNRYLWRSDAALELDGLAALPLFLGMRSAIRAMTGFQRARLRPSEGAAAPAHDPRAYLRAACAYLQPSPPRLVAVGGMSGTGKSTLAREIAHRLGSSPGALHLRTDLERKALFKVEELGRLPAASYTAESSRAVYARVLDKARAALAAGHSVVVDGTYLAAEERHPVERLAEDLGVPLQGIWLTAPPDVLLQRVADRKADASDATPDVVLGQLGKPAGETGWRSIDAGSGPVEALAQALNVLALPS